ncbi:DUF6118 family protein [Asticcacaulis benevestitus]|uniref:Uncharacterized protein n=1 Tax=Asticcacaulis benevestitus DSM 16100 = ATCC BAA-896 TaxID=1121022 RepID=V4P3X0_9CAUL|nr:DUF6118 family protein [Asticcacaulis benevestitus]ESQ82801.1 hypothetical protein ABENE_20640 [Asticcacaulis benevestitus DSM 16100 = ATCC BAA-896]
MVDDRASTGGEDDGDEATRAFEALRKSIDRRNTATTAELKVIRKGVEALFDQVETLQARPDYAEDLGQLKKGVVFIAERLKGLEASPMVQQGVGAFERAGEGLVKTAAQAFDQKAQRFDSAAFMLERITQGLRNRRDLRWQIAIAASFGVITGVVLLLLLPRLLPFDADSHVAASVIGKDRWEAGSEMMKAADPASWALIAADARLGKDNADVLTQCRQAAQKSGQTQRCTIKVTPGRP